MPAGVPFNLAGRCRRVAPWAAALLCAGGCSSEPIASVNDLVPGAPVQVSPADSAVLTNFPRTTVYVWHALPAAKLYGFDVDCFHCCVHNEWCTDIGQPPIRHFVLLDTTVVDNFIGAQPGRWRVWGINSLGDSLPKSHWRVFTYVH